MGFRSTEWLTRNGQLWRSCPMGGKVVNPLFAPTTTKCQPGTYDDCLSSLKIGLNCANAIGAMLTYDNAWLTFPMPDAPTRASRRPAQTFFSFDTCKVKRTAEIE